MAATVGVPQEAVVKYVDDGGKYVTMVHGAVPGVAPVGAVPPEIGSLSVFCQSVVIVHVVDPAFFAREC